MASTSSPNVATPDSNPVPLENVSTTPDAVPTTPTSQADAASTIQRNYRGYRSRRQIKGMGLDPSTRWIEAVKEAQYRNLTGPRPRREPSGVPSLNGTTAAASIVTADVTGSTDGTNSPRTPTFARDEWKRLKEIASRAHNDDTSESEGEEGMDEAELREHRRKKAEDKKKREKHARNMGLSYWLELVDNKHRYGSHLRSYHAVWKTADTHDNFFYWLDEGDGRFIDTPKCSREVLDRDRVRYLSREDRQSYLVKIDKRGRLRWAKNGELVNTSYHFKDSMKGIVDMHDTTPAYREDTRYPNTLPPPGAPDPDDGPISSGDSGEDSDADNGDLKDAEGAKKVEYIPAAALLNHLVKSSTKKSKWIFVADTSMRLYIGIKQSGAFQHSSFLHGARIAAAGLIKVKDGQLRNLYPLSGHYRPPTSAFRAFVSSLKETGVDLSRVNISKSYAVLLGLEGYMRTKQRAKNSVGELERHFEKMMDPEKAKKREQEAMDKSQSARIEREWMERERAEKKEKGWRGNIGKSFGLHRATSGGVKEAGEKPV